MVGTVGADRRSAPVTHASAVATLII